MPVDAQGMPIAGLAGKLLMPREVADHLAFHFRGHELVKGIATALGESQGSVGAWHDNVGPDGVTVLSRDCGATQINIPAAEIGTGAEAALRTESLDPKVWGPVAENDFDAMYRLYEESWTRNGAPDIRRWEAWVAYTSGYATWTAWWHWSPADQAWEPTGRYLQRAIAGLANYHIVIANNFAPENGLTWTRDEAAHWGLDGEPYLKPVASPPNATIVAWRVPPKPTSAPTDNIGPKPASNDGV